MPPGMVLDGELVMRVGDRTDFAALQRRVIVRVDPAAQTPSWSRRTTNGNPAIAATSPKDPWHSRDILQRSLAHVTLTVQLGLCQSP